MIKYITNREIPLKSKKNQCAINRIKNLKCSIIKEEKMREEKIRDEKNEGKQIKKSLRLMIVGIPNVGKSSLINRLVGSKAAKAGNKPGVTKQKKWIRIDNNQELLDTPGVLWPKFENEEVALNLAFTGSIKDVTQLREMFYISKMGLQRG